MQTRSILPTAIILRAVLATTVLCAVGSAAYPEDSSKRPSVEDFFRNPLITKAALSPDGKLLGLTGFGQDGRVRLYVADLSKPFELREVGAFSDADVRRFFWVNNRRLVYDAVDLRSDRQTGNGGLWAVDWDGSHFVQLIAADFRFHQEVTGTSITSRVLPTTHAFFSSLPGDVDDIVVAEYVFRRPGFIRTNLIYNPDYVRLIRLNTRSREKHDYLDKELAWVRQWVLDQDGDPRIAISINDNVRTVSYREKGSKEWRTLDQRDPYDPGILVPLFIDPDDGLYAMRGPLDTVYRVDLKDPAQAWKPFLALNGFDFDGSWQVDRKQRKLLGVHFQTDARGTRWIEPRMLAAQKAIDEALPATINRITCGNCLSSRFFLVSSETDRQPTRYFLFDPANNKLVGVTSGARPWIDPKQMGLRDFVRYVARDGLKIPAYLTLPPGRRKEERLPLVVLVHGGPWVRGVSWEWDPEAQFLATRDYAVIQPEFRGSTGFGYDHFHAGWHQWGLAMQDDLADAVAWAVAQGYALPGQVAIGGGSYGGYATLMGLIKDPQLYRCGFEFAGVTDIGLLYSINWSDASDEVLKYGMPALVADPEKDAAQIEQTSPLKNAQRLTQPLLMAYGGEDIRVPITHGTEFRDAVMRTNKHVEWLVYNHEGHGFRREDDRIDYWRHVEAFLDRCLK